MTGPVNGPHTARLPEDEIKASTFELFFDLVFVFTLTQLTTLLSGQLSARTVLRVGLIFTALFWMYSGYVWLTNEVPPDRAARRVLVIIGMIGFFVCALAVPSAFDGGGVVFGAGYLTVVLVHAGLWVQAYGTGYTFRFGAFNVVAAVVLIMAGIVQGVVTAYGSWLIAIMILFVSPRVAGRAAPRFPLRPGHFVERHGLLLIVALGESVVAVGIGARGAPLDLGLLGTAVLGLSLAVMLWWMYFAGDDDGAERAMRRAAVTQRFRLAINGYFFAFTPILLGVVTAAAGIQRSAGRSVERLDVGSALLLGLGVALYLGGDVAFRHVMGIRPLGYRAGAAIAALGTVVLGRSVAAVAQLIGLMGIVVATLAIETVLPGWAARRRHVTGS